MKRIHKLLEKIRPAKMALWLEREAEIPARTIAKHYLWVDGKKNGIEFPARYGPGLVRALCKISGIIRIGGFVTTPKIDGIYIYKEKEFEGAFEDERFVTPFYRARTKLSELKFSEWLQQEAEQ